MLRLNFTPFPTLTTERLLLRQVFPADANEIFFLRSNQTVLQFINMPPIATTEQAMQWIEKITLGQDNGNCINWGISIKGNEKIIGNICFWKISSKNSRAETGYTLHPDFHGKGIMQEAMEKILEYGFDVMKLQGVEAYTSPSNSQSTKLLERNGFIRQTIIKEKDASGAANFENAIYILKNPKL